MPILIPTKDPAIRYAMVDILKSGFFTKSKILRGPIAWININVKTADFMFIKRLKKLTIKIAEPKPEMPCINQLRNTIRLVIRIRFNGL